MLQVLYFVHDLNDAAVRRRVMMLKAGGASVTLAGFRRGDRPARPVEGVLPIDLGMTHDRRFGQRVMALGAALKVVRARRGEFGRPDVIIARSLEMLAIASFARRLLGAHVRLVYESLDIHRLLLRRDALGSALRRIERRLGRGVALLITSSPGFVREYFHPTGQIAAPVLLLENRVISLDEDEHAPAGPRSAGTVWTIGWFGALRCRQSLEMLAAFTRRQKGAFEVVLRGRPAESEFDDFHGFVEAEPYLRFEGAYRNPEDLATIYSQVHFTWAIDYFEEGQNSKWLLPNRLYEGCLYGAVPIAMSETETARYLADRSIGLTLTEKSVASLDRLLAGMTVERYALLEDAVAARDSGDFVCRSDDVRRFVQQLADIPA